MRTLLRARPGAARRGLRPSHRLPAWNVKELVAHLYRTINRINTGLDQTVPPEPDYDSVTYWRSYDPTIDSSDIADRAKELAASYGSGQELVSAWDEMWRRALGRARRHEGRLGGGPALRSGRWLVRRGGLVQLDQGGQRLAVDELHGVVVDSRSSKRGPDAARSPTRNAHPSATWPKDSR